MARRFEDTSSHKLLTVLEHKGRLTQKELISEVDLPSRTIRYALKRLIEMGLIIRRNNLQDMRSVYYFIAEN